MSIPLGLTAVVDSPQGRLGISTAAGALQRLVFLSAYHRLVEPTEPLARQVVARLEAFFADPHTPLDIGLSLYGTEFQRRVWRALQRIDVGTVCTYGELARQLATSARAVGGACRANPVPIVIPCHRVVARGGLGGFAGHGSGRLTGIKKQLLRHEGVEI